MYYISGKTLVKQNGEHLITGWSVVTHEGVVCATMVGGMSAMAAMIVCDELNGHPEKYRGPLDTKKMIMLSYDDNKIIDDARNVAVLESLYFSTTFDKTVVDIQHDTQLFVKDITNALSLLVKEGWVSDYNHHEHHISEGKFRISVMGRMKLECLTGVTNNTKISVD